VQKPVDGVSRGEENGSQERDGKNN